MLSSDVEVFFQIVDNIINITLKSNLNDITSMIYESSAYKNYEQMVGRSVPPQA